MDLSSFLKPASISLAGKKVLVTGASSGIGLATACQLAEKGCDLILVARRGEKLEELAAALSKSFPKGKVDLLSGDVRSDDFYSDLAEKGFDDVDILVNNAGLAADLDPVLSAKLLNWQRMIDTNVTAAFRLIHQVLPHMTKRGGGHIINVASLAGIECYEKGTVYCATKHAVRAFSKALRQETCDKNVRVTVVSPGMVKTEFSLVRFGGDFERAQAVYANMNPLESRDVAAQIVHALCEPAHVNLDEIVILPTMQGSATKTHRL